MLGKESTAEETTADPHTKRRLLILILGPLFTVLFFAVPTIYQRIETVHDLSRSQKLFTLWESEIECVSALQLERGASAGAMTSSAKFKSSVALNREATDESLVRFGRLIAGLDPLLTSHQRRKLEDVKIDKLRAALDSLRNDVNTGGLPVVTLMNRYGELIRHFMYVHEVVASGNVSEKANRLLLSNLHLAQMIEAIGQQRGLLAFGLSDPSKVREIIGSLYAARSAEKTHRHRFILERDPAIKTYAASPEEHRKNKFASQLVEKIISGDAPNTLGIDASGWFDFQTKRMEGLKNDSKIITNLLSQELEDIKQTCLLELWLFSLVGVVGIGAGAVYGSLIASQLGKTVQKLSEYSDLMKDKNEKLEKLSKEKDAFLSMASHDLRSPLGSIKVASEFLLEQLKGIGEKSVLSVLNVIFNQSNFMLDLVSDFLDVSIIESGKLKLNLAPTNLKSLVEENIALHLPLATKKDIKIALEQCDPLPPLNIDAHKIQQVLTNLITNSIKFSFPNTAVNVRVLRKDTQVVIDVQDQGQGIPAQELGKLFQPLPMLSVRSTGGEKSTGLGLVIAKKIVEAHGGSISVVSAPGKGSCFSLSLPLPGNSAVG